MANLTLPTLDYVTTLTAPAVSTVIIYDYLLTGAAIMALPETTVETNIELVVDGESLAKKPVIEVVIGTQLKLNGECETPEPTTTNTPTNIAYGLKGIV